MSEITSKSEYPPEQYPYRIKNWDKFQHYKHRNPPWVKLHTDLLISPDWLFLSDHSRLIMLCCMMVASRYAGHIPADTVLFKRLCRLQGNVNFKPLIECGFLIDLLADASACKQMRTNAPTETETETETEKNKNRKVTADGGSKYVFESGVIRINKKDMDRWRSTFTEIDVPAELEGMVGWAAEQGPNWFHAVRGLLAKRNREAVERRKATGAPPKVGGMDPNFSRWIQ